VLAALSEEEEVEESNDAVEELQSELKEHREVVKYLREKLTEVNLLNAKLLFTNKLFRAFGMNNEQKMKVVETFDRAKTLREIKLVYATVAENFGKETINPIKESKKGSASKAVASTKSEKQEIISEGTDMKARFQKLANIL
jgi:sulfur relay (sulfurtransferase) DsrC/TusE family protein